MNRDAWEFPYTADKLLAAAIEKCAHHTDELHWWQDKKTKSAETLKAYGLGLNLVSDLQESVDKVAEPQRQARGL